MYTPAFFAAPPQSSYTSQAMKNRYVLFVNHIYTLNVQQCLLTAASQCAYPICTWFTKNLGRSMIQLYEAVASKLWEATETKNMELKVGQSVSSLANRPRRKRNLSSLCCSCGVYQINQVQQGCCF